MKKHLTTLSTILLFAFTALVMAACGGSDKKDSPENTNQQGNIVGTWKWAWAEGYNIYTFSANHQGTILHHEADTGENYITPITMWQYDASTNLLYVTINGDTETVKIMWVDDNNLYTITTEGDDEGRAYGPYIRQ